jgi:hypothetical protein
MQSALRLAAIWQRLFACGPVVVDALCDLGWDGRFTAARRRLESRSGRPAPLGGDSLEFVGGDQRGLFPVPLPHAAETGGARPRPKKGSEPPPSPSPCSCGTIRFFEKGGKVIV